MTANVQESCQIFTAGKRWHETCQKALRYYQRRLDLIEKLGGKCVECGYKKRLEFDHINGRDWEPSKKSRWTRIARYEREAKEGKLQILCRWCNASKG